MTWLKACVVLFALANAGYFLWARGVGAVPAADAPVAATAAPSLRLVSEGPAARRSGTAAAPPGTIATPDMAAAPGMASAPVADTSPAGAGSAPGPGQGANAAGESARTEGTAATSGTIPAASGAAAAATEPRATSAAANAGLLTDVKRCITVGPFPDVSEAAHAAATLRGGGYAPRERVAEGEVSVGVWVYLTMPSTLAVADQIRSKLKAGGIDDALEMPGPNDKPVISLGLYSEPKRAQARVAQAQQLGLNPGIADRKRAGNVYWVDIDLKPTDALLNPADLQGESGRIVRLEVKACPPPSQAP